MEKKRGRYANGSNIRSNRSGRKRRIKSSCPTRGEEEEGPFGVRSGKKKKGAKKEEGALRSSHWGGRAVGELPGRKRPGGRKGEKGGQTLLAMLQRKKEWGVFRIEYWRKRR